MINSIIAIAALIIVAVLDLFLSKDSPSEKNYKIRKGRHRSTYSVDHVKGNLLFTFKFTEEHHYRHIPGWENNDDINKLYGLTTLFIHQNSVRIGWRENVDGMFELFQYTYKNGMRIYSSLYLAFEGEKLLISIESGDRSGKITIIGTNAVESKFYIGKRPKYAAYPYFGGDQPAPKEMNFFISRL